MVKDLIPQSLQEVLEFINENDSKIIAGGTDLMVQRRNWANVPALFDKSLVYIFNLKELKYIEYKDNKLIIGACAAVSDIVLHPNCPKSLKEAIDIMASPALRNLATIAGNIMNASPAGDTLPILYMLDADVKVQSVSNERIIAVKDVIKGPRKTSLNSNEIITEIIIPVKEYTKEVFKKVGGRKADAISKVSMSAVLDIEDDLVTDFRVAFGAVGPTVVRSVELEEKYINISYDKLIKLLPHMIDDYTQIIKPIDDQRSNKDYRKKVALNLLKDFIKNT